MIKFIVLIELRRNGLHCEDTGFTSHWFAPLG